MNNFNFRTCYTSDCPESCEGCIFNSNNSTVESVTHSCDTCSNKTCNDKKHVCHFEYKEEAKKEPRPLVNSEFSQIYAFMIILSILSVCILLLISKFDIPTSKRFIIMLYFALSLVTSLSSYKIYKMLYSLMKPKQ